MGRGGGRREGVVDEWGSRWVVNRDRSERVVKREKGEVKGKEEKGYKLYSFRRKEKKNVKEISNV